jgi:hypothetical protein
VRPAPQHAKPALPAAQHAAPSPAPRPSPRSRHWPSRFSPARLSRRWLIAALITAAVAVLAPGISYATASQSSQPSNSVQSAQSAASCFGVHKATFPAVGFIDAPGRTQGGHTWWSRMDSGSICIGTVVEFVQYTATETKTWRVIAYSTAHPAGQTVASGTFTLRQGWYLFPFRVRRAFAGLSKVCITADFSFGAPCIQFR